MKNLFDIIREVTTSEVRRVMMLLLFIAVFFIIFVSCVIVFNNLTGLPIRLGILIIQRGNVAVSEHVIMVTQRERERERE